MLSFLRSWVLNIVTLIIFITFLEILLPNNSIKKYIKMIIGLLVMVIILNPLLDLVDGDISIENEIFKANTQLDQKSLALSMEQLEKKQNQQMINQYKSSIENSIKERIEYENNTRVLSVSSVIEEDLDSKSFGKIKEVSIVIAEDTEDIEGEDKNDSKAIPTIKISLGNEEKNKSSPVESDDDHLIYHIKKNISEIYLLDHGKVAISVEKNK